MNTEAYYVVVTRSPWGNQRETAIRGLKFATQEAAEAHIPTLPAYLRQTAFVDMRRNKIKAEDYAMTCQCCDRQIFAERGNIAHHGYERPGHGWQTASCFGAKRLPWEVDRSAVKDLIDHLKATLLRHEYSRCAVADEIEPATHHYYGEYDKHIMRSRYISVEVTRDSLDSVKDKLPQAFARCYGDDGTFDVIKAKDLKERDKHIAGLKRDIKEFEARYAGWKQTHKRQGKNWVKV